MEHSIMKKKIQDETFYDCGYGFVPLKVANELLDHLSQVTEIAKELQLCCDNMGLNNEEDPVITNRARSASVQLNHFLTNLPE